MLEGRRLFSALALTAAPPDLVGIYDGTAKIVFSPHSFHARATDSISLAISSEGSDGSIAGVLNDQFAGALPFSGRIRGTSVTADVAGSGTAGTISGHMTRDGIVLSGRLLVSTVFGNTAVHLAGRFSVNREPGVLGLFAHF